MLITSCTLTISYHEFNINLCLKIGSDYKFLSYTFILYIFFFSSSFSNIFSYNLLFSLFIFPFLMPIPFLSFLRTQLRFQHDCFATLMAPKMCWIIQIVIVLQKHETFWVHHNCLFLNKICNSNWGCLNVCHILP